jgi:hypothetical protein
MPESAAAISKLPTLNVLAEFGIRRWHLRPSLDLELLDECERGWRTEDELRFRE